VQPGDVGRRTGQNAEGRSQSPMRWTGRTDAMRGQRERSLSGAVHVSAFTDGQGANGISGVDPNALAVGNTVQVNGLQFRQGANPFMAEQPGDIFVTDLGLDATQGQLGRIGVMGDRANFAIQISREAAFMQGIRPEAVKTSIFTIPGGTTFGPDFIYHMTRLR
jgi:hypothetical protein